MVLKGKKKQGDHGPPNNNVTVLNPMAIIKIILKITNNHLVCGDFVKHMEDMVDNLLIYV